jgi:superfamily I DNA/RNA helicase
VGVFSEAMALMADGRIPYIEGGSSHIANLEALIADAQRLQDGFEARSEELLGFVDWKAVEDHTKTDAGAGLASLVSLVQRYGCAQLLGTMKRLSGERTRGEVALSTVHKAKGSEWDSVKLSDDFRIGDRINDEERKLFYVAITRARHP